MILHDVPYRSIFHVEGHGWFKKAALTIGNRFKQEGYIGDGDYFCSCWKIEGSPTAVYNVTGVSYWIGCNQEVAVFSNTSLHSK